MHEPILKQLGLTDDQIVVYETLLKAWVIKASALAQKTPFKRVLMYKLLDDLILLGLVEKDESGRVTLYKTFASIRDQCASETKRGGNAKFADDY